MATRRIEKILNPRDIDHGLFFNPDEFITFLAPNFSEVHQQQLTDVEGEDIEADFTIHSMDEDTQEIYNLTFCQRFNNAGNLLRRYFRGEWHLFVRDCVALTWAENVYALFLKVLIPGYVPRFRRSYVEKKTRNCVEFTNFNRRIRAIRRLRNRNRNNDQIVGEAPIVVEHAFGMMTDYVGCAVIECKNLVKRGWIRRQVFGISKQLLQLVMEDAIDDWLLLQINWLRREDVIAQGIRLVKEILWPHGKFFLKREITGSGSDDMDSHTFHATPRAASRKSESSSFERHNLRQLAQLLM